MTDDPEDLEYPTAYPTPCLLYFTGGGGQLAARGNPIFEKGVRLNCERAYECYSCELMQSWINRAVAENGYWIGWECDRCLRWTRKVAPYTLPGYYTSGLCTRCNWETTILQLVFRHEPPPPPTEEEDEMLPLRGPHSSG